MKKSILVLLALLLLATAALYILIPWKKTIHVSTLVMANKEALYRKLANPDAWKEWWPGEPSRADSSYLLNGIRFTPGAPRMLSIPFRFEVNNQEREAEFTLLAHETDSTSLFLETTFNLPANPVQRVKTYFAAKKLEESYTQLLKRIQETYSEVVHLYDYNIEKKLVVDSNLVYTSADCEGLPGNELVYALTGKLKKYIGEQGAEETGFPMLNVFTRDSIRYQVRVAIPVDRRMPDAGDIRYKWMLGGGNILITEVKGGPEEIKKAYLQVVNYVNDHKRIAPAIPFESLVTNRLLEKDSSKWITRIYYPVM